MNFDELRKRIDELDEALVKLLNERTLVVLEIGKLKKELQEEFYVPAREKAVLNRVTELNSGPLKNEYLQSIYREIMSASLALEHMLKVAYLGQPATFTHQAARARFGGCVEYQPCETIEDIFSAVEKNSADYGVVPIENSTEGAVTHTLDQFVHTAVKICAEIYLPIAHHLMATGPREEIRKVFSHPQVFGQCRRWLHENLPGVECVSFSSTTRAAQEARGKDGVAALASELAAELYGLEILERDVQDMGGNVTRFLVIGRSYGNPTGEDKTSLVFGVKHKVGALYDALSVFRTCDLNMTKIESRPSRGKVWEYNFYVDIEGHAEDDNVKAALQEMEDHCTFLTVLGAYPRAPHLD